MTERGGEFRDRGYLALPGRQEELIRRVAATGKTTVVVLNTHDNDGDLGFTGSLYGLFDGLVFIFCIHVPNKRY